ncbi:MAG TPA: cytochrome c peroxidase [Gemmatimonadales bacterium]|nr:cytochrome c peroxidase [Gemmatimonadales bacterium]
MNRIRTVPLVGMFWVLLLVLPACSKPAPVAATPPPPAAPPAPTAEQLLDAANPAVPLAKPPLGITSTFEELKDPPTPEQVRLGRWLFYDKRLSKDGTVACATCHRPENAFSEPSPVSTGIAGQKGGRKAPSFVNLAWTVAPNFFWDGRAGSLEEQAVGPMANPIEMGNTNEAVVTAISGVKGYKTYFKKAFGSEEVTIDRVAKAIASYERTRVSGNSAWDRWQAGDEAAVSPAVKKGHELFFGKAGCNQCHLGQNFTDNTFHNLGIGWNAKTKTFADEGRSKISKNKADLGAFKTPTLRDVSKHAPYMHDGSIATLREVVEHYNKGGTKNPTLDKKLSVLKLAPDEIDALVEMMKALDGKGYEDTAPKSFPE